MRNQRRNVVSPFAQWRKREWKNEYAMEQVLTEFAFAYQCFEIAVCGHDHAHVNTYRLGRADAFDFAFFEHPQQLGLHRQRHVTDFIQKESSALGLLKFADVSSRSAGE